MTNVWVGCCTGGGGGGGGTSGTIFRQEFVSTPGQTVFVLVGQTYALAVNALQVFINGVLQRITLDYTESSTSTFTLTEAAVTGDNITALVFVPA